MRWIIIAVVMLCQPAFALEEISWDKPSNELLNQQVCPMDSTADAMVVQKETCFTINISGSDPHIYIISKKRIKIYTEQGLEHSEFKQYYDKTSEIKSIEAYCYMPGGGQYKLSKKDIHDELVIKDEKRNIKYKAKSFALPRVTPGSVIDVYVKSVYKRVSSPPVFRYHESIPVRFARFIMIVPPYFFYNTLLNNQQLIEYNQTQSEIPIVGKAKGRAVFISDGSNIPAIESELFKPPVRNLAADLWMSLTDYDDGRNKKDYALTWNSLLKWYRKEFKKSLKKSKKARKVADSLKTITNDEDELIKLAYRYVRDRWANNGLIGIGAPSDKVDKMMKWDALDSQDKSTVLCAVLRHLEFESEVVWVCSDDSDYSPQNNFPSLRMFDYALTYISSKSLYLDVADPGGEPGILDVSLSKRLLCWPMIEENVISETPDFSETSGLATDLKLLITETPEFDKLRGSVTDLKLTITDENDLEGRGKIIFYNQSALEARRVFKSSNDEDRKEYINDLLFRDHEETIKSFHIASDSVQSAEQYQVEFEIEIEDYIDDEVDFENLIYPGQTFGHTTIDYKPPRLYPIYFKSNVTEVFNIEWNFGDNYYPLSTDALQFNEDNGFIHYTMLTEYDNENNRLSVRRQYRRTHDFFPSTFSQAIEELWQKAKEHDLTSIILEKQ